MPSKIRTASVAVACLLGFAFAADYSPDLGYMGAQYSAAAYCLYEDVSAWACGPPCDNDKLQQVYIMKNPNKNSFLYAGYSASIDQIVVAFRGTNGLDYTNWGTNIQVITSDYPFASGAQVHKGFYDAYKPLSPLVISATRDLRGKFPGKKIFVTGHSLGGALATLAALDIKRQLMLQPEQITLYTYGQPRVGDIRLANHAMQEIPNYIRVTHSDDAVPHVPPSVGGYLHGGHEVWYRSKDHDGKYQQCNNYPGTRTENGQCSNQQWLKFGYSAHLSYVGVAVSNNCKRKQPSNTLAGDEQGYVYELLGPLESGETFLN